MSPLLSRIGGGRSGFGFAKKGKKIRPKGRYLTVPAAVNAPLSWNLDVDGPLTLNGPAKHTITAGTPEWEWSGTISVAMWGAGGPGAGGAVGGGGGGSFGTITLNDGNNYIMVSGHASPLGGGGYSGIFQISEIQSNAWMIAGGGGQSGGNAAHVNGGDGGGTTGADGASYPHPNGNVSGGGGGSQVAGGYAGTPTFPGWYPTRATAGGALSGGNGANGSPRGIYPNVQPLGPGGGGQIGANLNSWASGGGGGGYFGGGGGGSSGYGTDSGPGAGPAAAGGGGSGYINPTYVTGGNTYPYSTPTSKNHPLRGGAGQNGFPYQGAQHGKIVLT